MAVYKVENGENNNKIDFLVNDKSICTYSLDLYSDVVEGIEVFLVNTEQECNVYFYERENNNRDIFNIKKITSDNNYNYYLFNVTDLNNLAVSENKSTKEFKNLKDLGIAKDFGVITYETYLLDAEDKKCFDRKTIDVVDNYLSEFTLSNDDDIVYENQYTFKDGKIEKKTSNQKYYALCW